MSNAESHYQNESGLELKLFLDIDLKSEKIQEFYFKGSLSSKYALEFEELKTLVLNSSYKLALTLKRENLHSEVLLVNGKLPIASLSLWLLHSAIEDYLGTSTTLKSEKDLICLCFGIGKRELKEQVLIRPDYDLKAIISETMASSACGSCREQLITTLKVLREENGLISGLTHSQTRLDAKGHWLKIKGMYPSELLIKLDNSKNIWMKREGLLDQFQIEIINIEGHHLWLQVMPSEDPARNEKVLMALSDYWRSEIGALFFLHLAL